MNIISTMVGLSIMGAAAPSMMTMSIAPFEAQKRAQNLSIAESAAVTYAAQHEGATQLSTAPSGCDLDRTNFPAITITCTEGENNYVQTVSRSFRLRADDLSCDDNDGNNGHGNSNGNDCSNPGKGKKDKDTASRSFPFPINPYGFSGIECHGYENWGTSGVFRAWNVEQQKWTKASCVPTIMRTQANFDNSDPDEWLWDVNGLHDRGNHRLY